MRRTVHPTPAEGLSRVRTRTALGIVFVLALGACATAAPPSTPFQGTREQGVLVTVDNQDYRDATIFANWNGPRQRIGMVVGKTTETFSMPWRDFEVRFEVDFVGGGAMKTDPIPVAAGDHIDFVIPAGW